MSIADKFLEMVDLVASKPERPTDIWTMLSQRVLNRKPLPGKFKEAVEKLTELQREHDSSYQVLLASTETAAKAQWNREQSENSQHARKGRQVIRGRSLEQVVSDYLASQEAARHGMGESCKEAVPIAKPVCVWFVEAAGEVAEAEQAAEMAKFAEFGLPHVPSDLVCALHRLVEISRSRIPTDSQYRGTPRQLLPFLDI